MNTQNWDPGQIISISGQYWGAFVLHAAVELDVFTAVGNDSKTGEETAKEIGADTRGLTMLLNALVAMGFLTKKDQQYSNNAAGLSFLSKDSPQYIGHIIMHHRHLVDPWSRLGEAVKTGRPVRPAAPTDISEKVRESFLMGMFNIAMGLAPRVVPEIDLSGRRHLLDLGGGPGTYAIFFCQSNPGLKATVFDLPTTRPFAEKTIEQFGMSDRIDFMEGNFLEDEIDGKYDVVWLSHIIHGEGPENCRKIIRKAASALKRGGMILIHDFILDDNMTGPTFPAMFSLNMLIGTPQGQTYSEKQIGDWLIDSGAKNIRRIPLKDIPDSGVICGSMIDD
jgi:SAM-dependent methyltransferase